MPTVMKSSTTRSRASSRLTPRWRWSASPIWSPTRNTGFSEVIGSWKIMAMSLPRTSSISSSGSSRRLRPLKSIRPATARPGRESSRITVSAVMLLPHPDSPTSPRVSPWRTLRSTPSTARTTPSLVKKWVRRPRTRSSVSGSLIAPGTA